MMATSEKETPEWHKLFEKGYHSDECRFYSVFIIVCCPSHKLKQSFIS